MIFVGDALSEHGLLIHLVSSCGLLFLSLCIVNIQAGDVVLVRLLIYFITSTVLFVHILYHITVLQNILNSNMARIAV